MNRLKSRSASVAVIACFAAEAVFSNAMKTVFELSGKASPISILIGGLLVVAFMPFANKTYNRAIVLVGAVLYSFVILFRLASNTSYLYNGSLTISVLVGAVLLAVIAAVKGIRGAGIYCALCFVPMMVVFAVCCIFGGVDFNVKFLRGFIDSGIIYGSIVSASIFAPMLLCAMVISENNLWPAVVAGGISVLAVAAMMFIAVGVFGATAENYPSVIAEMSKNVSFGKFFQRLEGFADASYIVAASCVISVLGAIMGNCVIRNIGRIVLTSAMFILAGAIAYLSIKIETVGNIMLIVAVISGVAVILMIILSRLKNRKSIIALFLMMLFLLTGCTARREIETQTFVVITAFDGDRIHLVTENGSGKNMYTAKTDNLKKAVEAIELSQSVSISLLQAEMLLIGDGTDIQSAMNQALESDMPNSASIMLMDGDFSKLYEIISDKYHSAFDFVSAIQSNSERSGFVCEPASALKAEYEELGKMTIGILDKNGIKGNKTVVNSGD